MRQPGPRACRASHCAPRAKRSPPDPCFSRCRAAVTWPQSAASAAALRPGATAAGPLSCQVRGHRCAAAGAAPQSARSCRRCGHQGLRALVTGARRTAEELGRAFGSVPVVSSGGSSVLSQVGPEPAVVVATPGAEPIAESGYAAAILVDGWAMLGLASLRAAEEALRRWMTAAALVRPGPAGGTVVVVADALAAGGAGTDPVGSGDFRRPRARRAHRAAVPAGGPDGGGDRPGGRCRGAAGSGQAARPRRVARPAARGRSRCRRCWQAPGPIQELVRYLVRVPRSEGGELATGAARRAGREDRGEGARSGAGSARPGRTGLTTYRPGRRVLG